ncbi:MAG: hypothetical protein KKH92_09995 [Firmicutes bacterium]|nr:hypothetical protein [Bacillota bacterium]
MRHFIGKYHKYFNIYTTTFSFVIFLLFIIFVLPAESLKSTALGLEMSPDTSIFYTASRLYEIALSYGAEGRQFYIQQRFTFDLVWPIAYGLFLFTSSIYFFKYLNLHKVFFRFLWLPVLAVAFDYLENLMTALVMYRYPNQTFFFDMAAGVMTLFKWITLGLAFVMLMVWIAMYILKKIRNQKNSDTLQF